MFLTDVQNYLLHLLIKLHLLLIVIYVIDTLFQVCFMCNLDKLIFFVHSQYKKGKGRR